MDLCSVSNAAVMAFLGLSLPLPQGAPSTCTSWGEDITIIFSHDDSFNYGHFLADAWNAWYAPVRQQ